MENPLFQSKESIPIQGPSWSNFYLYFIRKIGISTLRSLAHQCQLTSLGIRLNSWRLFLGIFPENGNTDSWLSSLTTSREFYKNLKKTYTVSDPLIDKNQILKIRSSVQKDMVRTFQTLEFFTRPAVQDAIVSILSFWSVSHPLGYLQGMSEIASVIYFVVSSEQCREAGNLLNLFNNPEELESDTYTIFARLFEVGLQNMYMRETKEKPKAAFVGLFEELNFGYTQDDIRSNPVIKVCHDVFEVYLKKVDPGLFDYLKENNVESHLFLLRWFRCLFSRELELKETLIVWDFIFSYVGINIPRSADSLIADVDANKEIYIAKFVAVALVVSVRSQLTTDSSAILNTLTSYPKVKDMSKVIQLAMQCKEFLAQNNEMLRPIFNTELSSKVLDQRQKEKVKKKKSFGFIDKLKGKQQEKIVHLEVFNQELSSNHKNVYTDPCIAIITKVQGIIVEQKQYRSLNKLRISEALKLLETLKSNSAFHA